MKIKTYLIVMIFTTVSLILCVQLFSFAIFRGWGNKTTNRMFDTMVEQTASQIIEDQETIKDIALKIATHSELQKNLFKPEKKDFIQQGRDVERAMRNLIYAHKKICYAAIVERGMIKLSTYQDADYVPYRGSPFTDLTEVILRDVKKNQSVNEFTPGYKSGNSVYFAYISTISSMDVDIPNDYDKVIVIFYQTCLSQNTSKKASDNPDLKIMITDSDANIMDSTNIEDVGKSIYDVKQERILRKERVIAECGWHLICSIPAESILNFKETTLFLMVITIVLNVLIVIFLGVMLLNVISKSVSNIERDIEVICEGNWEHRIKIDNKNEIGKIAKNINYMLDRIDALEKEKRKADRRIYEAEQLQKRTMNYYLQCQISPHFLYNSMEHIKGLALKKGAQDIANMAVVLSKVFRYCLKGATITTIGEDLDNALDYFNVINMRRTNPIILDYDIADVILTLPIIRMVFQPIFENCLRHGLKYETNGIITIKAQITDENVKITVRDNGVGIEKEKLEEMQKKLHDSVWDEEVQDGHIGLLNLNKRIKLYYGNDCGLLVDGAEGEQFETTVIIKQHLSIS